MGYLFSTIFVIAILFVMSRVGAETPLFKMKCENCGKKDRDWQTNYIGHDDFAWQHSCLRNDD